MCLMCMCIFTENIMLEWCQWLPITLIFRVVWDTWFTCSAQYFCFFLSEQNIILWAIHIAWKFGN